jgi:hypothetical protein
VASSYSLQGKDVEYAPAAAGATPPPFAFSIGTNGMATLLNYCNKTACSSTYQIYLAQGVGNGNGNGSNGIFSEWRCHQQYFAKVNWPNTRPNGYSAIQGDKVLDPMSNSSIEGNIYGWDSGTHKCT